MTIILACLIFQGMAWGPTGHRVTGAIAERYLTKKAQKKLHALLGQESLPLITTWMDEIRSDSTYTSWISADWHWVTIPEGETYDTAEKNPKGDIIATIDRMIRLLKAGGLEPAKEVEYIKILAHLVGDLHQPLHVGTGNDQGGNQAKVQWFGSGSNLHRVWDSDIIDNTKLSYTELTASLHVPDKLQVAKWQDSGPLDWAMESMSYRKQVYGIGNGKLSYEYAYWNYPIIKLRLLQAGVRLAGVLNEIYG